jgi:hypothetical protein
MRPGFLHWNRRRGKAPAKDRVAPLVRRRSSPFWPHNATNCNLGEGDGRDCWGPLRRRNLPHFHWLIAQ